MTSLLPRSIAAFAMAFFGLGGYVAMATSNKALLVAALVSWLVALVSVCLIQGE